MTQAWSPITLSNVAATGDLVQLYPEHVSAGSGATTAGTERRKPLSGVIYRAEVYAVSGVGGAIELWDVAGLDRGASNNVDTGTTLTNAYLQAERAAGRAKLLWTQNFAGTSGARYPVFNQRVPFMKGLAARFISGDTGDIILSIVADGGYTKQPIAGE